MDSADFMNIRHLRFAIPQLIEYMHGWETRWNDNVANYLCYCPGLCRNVVLHHHVCIVFLLKQPIATSWCSQRTIP